MTRRDCSRIVSREARRRCEQRHAWLMFGAAFPLCLFVAALVRVVPRSMLGSISGFDGSRSMFREARSAASMFIPFAFR
jgi:hypothetical protein